MTSINYSFSIKKTLSSLIEEGDVESVRQLNLTLNDLEIKNQNGSTPLKKAKDLKQQIILDHFFKIALNHLKTKDALDYKKRSLIHWAVKCNQSHAKLTELKNLNFNLDNHDNPYHLTPLYLATQEGNTQLVKSLIALGADPNIPVVNGGTPLHAACEFCDAESVDTLIQAGANINSCFEHAGTPLCIAAQLGRKEIIVRLLNSNANPKLTNKDGKTPADLAIQHQHEELAPLLNTT